MPVKPRKRVRQRKSKKSLVFWVSIVVCSLAILLFSDSGVLKLVRLEKEKKQLEEEIRKLQTEYEELDQDIEQLRNPEYVAQLAREKYRMVKPQEKVFKVVEEPAGEQQ